MCVCVCGVLIAGEGERVCVCGVLIAGERERECVCVCVCGVLIAGERERVCVCVCAVLIAREGERVCVCGVLIAGEGICRSSELVAGGTPPEECSEDFSTVDSSTTTTPQTLHSHCTQLQFII